METTEEAKRRIFRDCLHLVYLYGVLEAEYDRMKHCGALAGGRESVLAHRPLDYIACDLLQDTYGMEWYTTAEGTEVFLGIDPEATSEGFYYIQFHAYDDFDHVYHAQRERAMQHPLGPSHDLSMAIVNSYFMMRCRVVMEEEGIEWT